MGAIVDPSQRKSIDRYVEQARQEGAEIYQACATIPKDKGCFYPPTLITKVQPVSTCVQEEVRRRRERGEGGGGRGRHCGMGLLPPPPPLDIWSCACCPDLQDS